MSITYGGDNITFPDGSTQNTSPQTGFVNRIINGDMRIDQRNAGASVTPTNGQYTLDRWGALSTQTSKYSVQQNAGAVTPPTGFANYLGITSLSAYSVISTDVFWTRQAIEGFNFADLGWGTASAQTVTLSFLVRSSLTGTFGGSFINGANNRCYAFSYSIPVANTWTTISVTVAGDTTGTYATGNTTACYINFCLGAGASNLGTANTWGTSIIYGATGATSVVGTSGATFYITGVQLEKGSTATPFEFRSIGQELALCQRYFCKTFNQSTAPAQNAGNQGSIAFVSQSTVLWDAMWRFPVEMRAPPTATSFSTNAANSNWSLNTDTPIASLINIGTTGLICRASSPSGVGRGYSIHITATAEL